MRVKICGITQPDQGRAIAQLGANALGFICARQSPRYVTAEQIWAVAEQVLAGEGEGAIARIGVFVDATIEEIAQVVQVGGLTGVQLHGNESPEFCQKVRYALPQVEIIKALRVKDVSKLVRSHQTRRDSEDNDTDDIGDRIHAFETEVDTLLLDAYHPTQAGGTGQTIDWQGLKNFRPQCSWLLAGGLNPNNVLEALSLSAPDGIDLSSGLERSPGDKDLQKVALLFEQLKRVTRV